MVEVVGAMYVFLGSGIYYFIVVVILFYYDVYLYYYLRGFPCLDSSFLSSKMPLHLYV